MPAYVIVDIRIHDHDAYEGYKKLTPDSITAYDGKFIIRGGRSVTLEGDWQPERIVLLQFPTLKRAKEWWHSDEYAPAKKIRQSSAETRMITVEGVD